MHPCELTTVKGTEPLTFGLKTPWPVQCSSLQVVMNKLVFFPEPRKKSWRRRLVL